MSNAVKIIAVTGKHCDCEGCAFDTEPQMCYFLNGDMAEILGLPRCDLEEGADIIYKKEEVES